VSFSYYGKRLGGGGKSELWARGRGERGGGGKKPCAESKKKKGRVPLFTRGGGCEFTDKRKEGGGSFSLGRRKKEFTGWFGVLGGKKGGGWGGGRIWGFYKRGGGEEERPDRWLGK